LSSAGGRCMGGVPDGRGRAPAWPGPRSPWRPREGCDRPLDPRRRPHWRATIDDKLLLELEGGEAVVDRLSDERVGAYAGRRAVGVVMAFGLVFVMSSAIFALMKATLGLRSRPGRSG
jgi:hypothetical protein